MKSKMTIHAQEVIRIMNSSRQVTTQLRTQMLSHRMVKLLKSGYGEAQRKEILQSGLTGYYRMVATELKGGE